MKYVKLFGLFVIASVILTLTVTSVGGSPNDNFWAHILLGCAVGAYTGRKS